jgi:hypothetical protein
MVNKDRSDHVGFKIPQSLNEMIEKDIEINKDYRSKSEWIIAAIREFEKQRLDIITKRKLVLSEKEEESDFVVSLENDIQRINGKS